MSQYEEEEMENQPQTEEIEEAEGNEEPNEKETEENDQQLNSTIVESLIHRTKQLQEENSQLKKDLEEISTKNKGNAIEYFSKIRKEIFNKIEELNKKIKEFDKKKTQEEKQFRRDKEYVVVQLNEAQELNENLKLDLDILKNEIEKNEKLIKKGI